MPDHANAGSRGKPRRRIMRAFKINEISAVDVPAQEGAVAVLMKRNDEPTKVRSSPQTDELSVEKGGAALTTASDGHAHLIALVGHGGDEINSGMTSWVDEHSHPWIRTIGDTIVISMASSQDGEAHVHELGELSKLAEEENKAAGDEPGKVGNKEDTMTDKTQNDAAAADKATIEELQKKLDRANQVGTLNDADTAHLATLKEDAQGDFLAKSADDRKAVVDELAKGAAEADPVVYTTMDGLDLRKSVGEAFVAMAKSNDTIRKENETLRTEREQDALEKRAETDLKHIPGDVKTRAAMLKAIDDIKDESVREAAHNALKAQDEALSKAFEAVGHGGTVVPGSPADELEQLAKAHQEKNPGVTYEAASAAVLKTERGANLYAKSVN